MVILLQLPSPIPYTFSLFLLLTALLLKFILLLKSYFKDEIYLVKVLVLIHNPIHENIDHKQECLYTQLDNKRIE